MGANRFTSLLSQLHALVKKTREPYRLGLVTFAVDLDRWDPITKRGKPTEPGAWQAAYKSQTGGATVYGTGHDGADALASLLAELMKQGRNGSL